jgi:hypothetical protein
MHTEHIDETAFTKWVMDSETSRTASKLPFGFLLFYLLFVNVLLHTVFILFSEGKGSFEGR